MLPILLSNDFFIIYSYPLFIGFGWGIGILFTLYYSKKNKISESSIAKLMFGIFICSWIGSKLLFIFTQNLYQINSKLFNLSFWVGGGLVFYGGLIGAIVFLILYCFLLKKFELKNLYIIIPGICFGHAIGRVGCYMAGCCYGKTFYLLNRSFIHPVQLYESILLMMLGLTTSKMIKNNRKENLILIYLASYSIIRFILEFVRGDGVRGRIFTLSTSQFISILIVLFCCSYYTLRYHKKVSKEK